jgi:hypothetical protein
LGRGSRSWEGLRANLVFSARAFEYATKNTDIVIN